MEKIIQILNLLVVLSCVCVLEAKAERIVFQAPYDGSTENIYSTDPNGTDPIALTASNGEMPSFSYDGSKIVFRSNRSGSYQIYVMNEDGTNQVAITDLPSNYVPQFPSFSPDGSKVAFSASPDSQPRSIFVINMDGTGLTQLTDGTYYDSVPTFSPDGSRILFTRIDALGSRIFVMNRFGLNQVPLTDGSLFVLTCAFRPDGQKILYSTTNNGIYEMNADGSNSVFITLGGGSDPAYSADGTRVLFRTPDYSEGGDLFIDIAADPFDDPVRITNRAGREKFPSWGGTRPVLPPPADSGGKIVFTSYRDFFDGVYTPEIYIMDSDGSNQTRLTDFDSRNSHGAISFDGSKIVYESDAGVTEPTRPTEIYIMNVDGTNKRRLTNNLARDERPSFSPDGSQIVFTSDRGDGDWDVYIMNTDGTNVRPLTDTAADDWGPRFSPDGSKIAFTSDRDGTNQIYVMDPDGMNPTRLTSDDNRNFQPAYSADGHYIVYTSQRPYNGYDIKIMRANGTGALQVATGVSDPGQPVFSPDDSTIAFAQSNGPIYSVKLDGSDLRMLAGPSRGISPSWGPAVEIRPMIETSGVSLTEGTTTHANIATVSDLQDESGELFVSVVGSEPAGGVTLSNIAVDAAGNVSADVDAGAGAVDTAVTLRVTDSDGSYREAVLLVTVTPADHTPPSITPTVTGTLGDNGWYTSDISVSWAVADSESGIVSQDGCDTVSVTSDTSGTTLSCTAESGGGSDSVSITVKRDATAPVLAPMVSPNPVSLGAAATASANASDTGSGVASESCEEPVTGSVGSKTLDCIATDNAGNTRWASVDYRVVYEFTGFFQPVENLPIVNVATAGSSIPIKFSLAGYQGLGILAPGYPASAAIQCGGTEPVSTVEETVSAGSSGLSYDASTNRYVYVWKTDKRWRGSCRQLLVRLSDGSTYAANFRFR